MVLGTGHRAQNLHGENADVSANDVVIQTSLNGAAAANTHAVAAGDVVRITDFRFGAAGAAGEARAELQVSTDGGTSWITVDELGLPAGGGSLDVSSETETEIVGGANVLYRVIGSAAAAGRVYVVLKGRLNQ